MLIPSLLPDTDSRVETFTRLAIFWTQKWSDSKSTPQLHSSHLTPTRCQCSLHPLLLFHLSALSSPHTSAAPHTRCPAQSVERCSRTWRIATRQTNKAVTPNRPAPTTSTASRDWHAPTESFALAIYLKHAKYMLLNLYIESRFISMGFWGFGVLGFGMI